MIDDFSYVKSAWVFADTHRLVYNGWATATIGWQIAWGGLFARVFGHTFTAVRLSTFVTSFLTVWLAQAVFARCGLLRRNAATGALAVGLSPIFLPMSISFMTDISGLFSILLCLYCCLRALESEEKGGAIRWLVAAGLLSTLGATARQIAWMAPLVMVPSAAWLLRRRRGVPVTAVLLWMAAAAAMLGSMRWFAHQPLSVPEGIVQGAVNLKSLRELVGNMTAAALCLLLLLVPLLAAWTPRRTSMRKVAGVIAAALALTVVFRAITLHGMERGFAPWTGDVLDKIGMLDYRNAWFLGTGPTMFAPWSRACLSFLVLGVSLYFAFVVGQRERRNPTPRNIDWRSLLVLTVPFLLAYTALLAPRAMWNIVIDRYLLPPMALCVLFLLRLYQERVGPRLPAVTHVALAAFALFGVAGTHDWVAQHRARVEATQRLQSPDTPRTAIEAGYESDGLVQIQASGAVIDPRVTYPPSVDTTPWAPPNLPAGCREVLNPHTPAIHARYFLSGSASETSRVSGGSDCLVPSMVEPQTYTAWMPPFTRRVYILQRP